MKKVVMVIERALLAATMAVGASQGDNGAITLTPSGFASLREGQVVKGEHETVKSAAALADVDFVWIQGMDIGFNVEAKYSGIPVVGNLGMEMLVCNDNSPYTQDFGQSRRLNFYPYLSRADILYTKGDQDNPGLYINAGYFPFKYNNESRNLGEYLFRSGTYPQYLVTNFDFPMTRLMGVRMGGPLWGKFNWDVLLTTNVEWTAIGDPNLSALLSWKPAPLFELGLGGSWCSFLSALGVNQDKTSPMEEGNNYVYNGKMYYYTFAGHKVMGRMTFDFKQLFPGIDVFGQHDLKLYSEAAILGVVNYPMSVDGYTQYDTLWQRIPVMAGFNVPTLKFLDILSMEVEWFGSPYPNSQNSIRFDNQPVPLSSQAGEKVPYYLNNHGDDWKWSIYGRKTFMNNLNITVQAARDHFHWFRLDYKTEDAKDALRKDDEWYYTVKFGFTF